MEKYKKLKDSDFIDFEHRSYKNGVETLNISSLNEFLRAVKKFNGYPAYIWRGQRKDWPLQSSFDRGALNSGFVSLFKRTEIYKRLLATIKNKLNEFPENMQKADEDKIWAIGQHYGLPTILLDWTTCPYIATFFALFKKNKNEKGECRFLYALNQAVQRRKLGVDPFVKFLDLVEPGDDRQNQRLKNQEGRFTKALNGTDIEINVLNYAKRCKKDIIDNKRILLLKILIHGKLRDELLDSLSFKGIIYTKLFPDYAGAVESCKIDLGLDNF